MDSDKTLFYRLTALARDSETFVDFVRDDRVFIAPALTWVPNADTSVTFLAHLQHDRTGTVRQFLPASGTLFLNPHGKIPRNRFAGEPGFENLDRTQYSLGYLLEHRLSERWTLRQNARYDYLDIDYKALFGFGLQADLQTLNRFSLATQPEAHSLAIDTRLQTHIDTGALIHTILLGFDYQRYRLDNRQGFSFAAPAIDIFNPSYGAPVTPPAFSTNVLSEQDQIGFYLQDQVKIGEKWVLTLGGRLDRAASDTHDRIAAAQSSQQDDKFTGQAGLVYLAQSGLAPYVSYSESFLPVLGTNVSGQPFDPETGKQYEVGLKYQPRSDNNLVTVALFDLRRQNVLTPDPAIPFNRLQTGEIRSRGIEIEAIASLYKGLNLIASYAHLDAEVTKSNAGDQGKKPLSAPENTASLWIDYTVRGGLFPNFGLGLGIRYVGSAFGDTANTFKVPSYTVVDALLHYRRGGLRVALNAKNLLDREHVASCISRNSCLYGEPRHISLTVGYSF